MARDDEMEQVNHLVSKEKKQRAKAAADWGELSEAVRSVYDAFARSGGDTDVVRLQSELYRVRARLDAVEEQIESLETERDSLAEREAELSQAVTEAEADADQYTELLGEMVEALDRGESVWPDHATVQEAATIKGISSEAVIDELRERRPHLPDDRFVEGSSSGTRFSATETSESES